MSDSPFANIIFEDPSRDDAFHGKGHERSAKALADSIKQVANKKDGAIGLEGAWGAGKSSVLSMAEDALKKHDEDHVYEMFTFDLWTHHTDEFKRAFLEEFLTWCSPWLSPKQVKEQRGRIRNRVKEVDTTNRKTFSVLGVVLVLLLPFLPIAVSWISPVAFRESTDIFFNGFTLPEFILRVLLMLALVPVLILAAKMLAEWVVWPVVFGRLAPWWKRRREGGKPTISDAQPVWPRPDFATLSSEVLSLFSRDSRRDTVTQNIRDEDPTTVEFYKVFRELLAMVQVDKRRVVIVLDNIDRLPLSAVPAAWSEVRSVFATSDARVVEGNTRVIAVVPYDRTYIAEAFPKARAPSPVQTAPEIAKTHLSASESGSDPEAAREDSEPKSVTRPVPVPAPSADGFRFADGDIFNKMFSRILKVSPPVGSHWGDFLDAALVKAFETQHDMVARNKILRLLQVYLQRNLIHPTPRLIVGYVNEIGSYWTQRERDIPVESIALFVLLRSKIDESPDALTTPGLVHERYLNIVDQKDHWLEHLAALAFNVSVNDAAEVLLGDKIRVALLDEHPSRLAELHRLNGFEKFFQQYLTGILEELAAEDPKLVAAAALNVSEITLSDAVRGQVWKSFAQVVPKLAKIPEASQDEYPGLAKIAENQDASDAINVADQLRRKYTVVPSGTQIETGQNWARRMTLLAAALERKLSPKEAASFWGSSRVPNDGYFAAGAASELDPDSPYSYGAFQIRPQTSLLEGTLDVTLDSMTQSFRRAMFSLAPILSDDEKVTWLTKMATSLRGTDRTVEDAADILKAYVWLDHDFSGANAQAASQVKNLVRDGTLLWYAHKGLQEQDNDLLGDALLLIFKRGIPTSPPAGPHPTFGPITKAGEWFSAILTSGEIPSAALDHIVEQVTVTGALPDWLELAAQDQTSSRLFAEVAKLVVRLQRFTAISPGDWISRYHQARATLGEDEIRMLIVGMGASQDPARIRQDLNDDAVRRISPDLVTDIAKYAATSALSEIIARVDTVLKAMTTEEWTQSLTEEDANVLLAIARLKTGSLSLPAAQFLEAMQSHAISVLVSGVTMTIDPTEWNLLANALTPASRTSLAGRVLASMPRSGVSVDAVEVFVGHYRKIADALPLDEHPELAIDVFLRALVGSTSREALDYIRSMGKRFRDALDKAKADTTISFTDVIEGMEEGDEEERKRATEIRAILGLKSKNKKKP